MTLALPMTLLFLFFDFCFALIRFWFFPCLHVDVCHYLNLCSLRMLNLVCICHAWLPNLDPELFILLRLTYPNTLYTTVESSLCLSLQRSALLLLLFANYLFSTSPFVSANYLKSVVNYVTSTVKVKR